MTSMHNEHQKANAKPTRRARVMRGIVAPILGLLAVVFVVLGALNATIWKPDPEVAASQQISGTRYIVTDPGVLNLVDTSVDLKVSVGGAAQKSKVCVALASSKDATGWVAGHSYTRVTGLSNWSTLSSKVDGASKENAGKASDGDVAFKDSDMWRKVQCGTGEASIELQNVAAGDVAIIDLAGGQAQADAQAAGSSKDSAKSADVAKAPVTLRMHWVRQHAPNYALRFFIVAAVLVLAAVLAASVFAMEPERIRKMVGKHTPKRAAKDIEAKAISEEVTISEAMTGSFQALKTSLEHSSHKHAPAHTANHIASSHGADDAGAADQGEGGVPSSPSIIDPMRRNMVANVQAQSAADIGYDPNAYDPNAETSVIDMDEMNKALNGGLGKPGDLGDLGDLGNHNKSSSADTDINTNLGDKSAAAGADDKASKLFGDNGMAYSVPSLSLGALAGQTETEPDDAEPDMGAAENVVSTSDSQPDDVANVAETVAVTPAAPATPSTPADELQAYFQRLAAEESGNDSDGDANNDNNENSTGNDGGEA
ncbi:hypothetical protein [Bifidobacterium sp. ESL0790]|uniref:hypothetical protein n=1 Tax=Bifidobacterium sp. ESL0790 TaxID=2983233 RepID=UPI0023F9FCAE|nr:hypothetical protein [Bifidobacterium sp. ESL0790]WEV72267.1 hypothetical protein OZY47_07525 [Bifidobacterium sp. ESL0790]